MRRHLELGEVLSTLKRFFLASVQSFYRLYIAALSLLSKSTEHYEGRSVGPSVDQNIYFIFYFIVLKRCIRKEKKCYRHTGRLGTCGPNRDRVPPPTDPETDTKKVSLDFGYLRMGKAKT